MHISRGWAVALIFLATIGFLVLFGFLVIPPLIREVRQLASDIPGYIDKLKNSQGWIGDLERKYHLSTKLKEITDKLPTLASQSLGKVLGRHLAQLKALGPEALVRDRYQKFRSMGVFAENA
jgi:predicted PurR-regulated permease PerM